MCIQYVTRASYFAGIICLFCFSLQNRFLLFGLPNWSVKYYY